MTVQLQDVYMHVTQENMTYCIVYCFVIGQNKLSIVYKVLYSLICITNDNSQEYEVLSSSI